MIPEPVALAGLLDTLSLILIRSEIFTARLMAELATVLANDYPTS